MQQCDCLLTCDQGTKTCNMHYSGQVRAYLALNYPRTGSKLQRAGGLHLDQSRLSKVALAELSKAGPCCSGTGQAGPDALKSGSQLGTAGPIDWCWRVPYLMGSQIPCTKRQVQNRVLLVTGPGGAWVRMQRRPGRPTTCVSLWTLHGSAEQQQHKAPSDTCRQRVDICTAGSDCGSFHNILRHRHHGMGS